ncbi:MAG: hypothetical protein R8G66_22610 [Cytophagales bacterium]|nr:hypothetical protein [Cytophagales bacterium]
MKQFDTFILLEDVNPKVKQGMEGVILDIYNPMIIEVEFVQEDGTNIEFEGQITYQISPKIIKIKTT